MIKVTLLLFIGTCCLINSANCGKGAYYLDNRPLSTATFKCLASQGIDNFLYEIGTYIG
jgi:hypothetical protein